MNTHLRRWGIAIGLILAFTVPQSAILAQSKPDTATLAVIPAGTIIPSSAIKEVLNLKITAYTSLTDETDDTPFITADGSYVHDGVVATNLLPFGTKIMIPSLFGNKVFTVDDRMSRRFMHNLDIWMPSRTKAIVFGAHTANIVVLSSDSGADAAVATMTKEDSVALANATLAEAYLHRTPLEI